jgi:hypothetical protein
MFHRGMTSFLKGRCFPYVCPEPVLVKRSLLYIYIYGAKSPFSHLARPKVNLPSAVAVRETLPKPLNHRTHLPSIILFAQARGIAFKTTHCDAIAIRK